MDFIEHDHLGSLIAIKGEIGPRIHDWWPYGRDWFNGN